VWHAVIDRRTYVRTPRRTKKVARVRHDGRASFLVESGLDWAELCAVVVPVTATVVDDDADATGAAIDEKYAATSCRQNGCPAALRRLLRHGRDRTRHGGHVPYVGQRRAGRAGVSTPHGVMRATRARC